MKFTPPRPLKTALLFLVFNRLNSTKIVFQEIRKAKPPRLYIAADGARLNKSDEVERVHAVREYIVKNIDWNCEVKTLFREKNFGCKFAVSAAISWFFQNEDQGIILEDDCLPSQSFFWFCEDLLERYKNDNRVFSISGYNKQNKWQIENEDYFFSNYGGIWGWASWSRAWAHYDLNMLDIDEFIRRNNFVNLLGKVQGKERQKTIYDNIIVRRIDTWDYQWAYTRHKNNGLSCVPTKSLIENIGFGDNATHTFGVNMDNVCRHELSFPLKENRFIVPDKIYDEKFIRRTNLFFRLVNRIKKYL